MDRPAKADWVAVTVAALMVPVMFVDLATGLILVAFWLGTATMLVASRQRLPRFVPLRASAPKIQNLHTARIEGAPGPFGAYWMIFPFTLTVTVGPAALMGGSRGVLALGSVCALMCFIWLLFLRSHERGSARVLNRILAADPSRRIVGVVRELEGEMIRVISWHVWSGTHHGTARVQSVHGGEVDVATVTHTRNSMGYREEVRHPFVVQTPERSVAIDNRKVIWAATAGPLPAKSPPLRKRGTVEAHMLKMFLRVGAQREQVREGDRVVVLCSQDAAAIDELHGSKAEALVLYAVAGEADPVDMLVRHRGVRRTGLLLEAACLLMIVGATAWTQSSL